MSAAQTSTEVRERTAVYDASVARYNDEVSKSALLAESGGREPFTMFFSATFAHREPWNGGGDALNAGLGIEQTPLLTSERQWRIPTWRPRVDLDEQDLAAAASSDRVTLLARKYVGKEHFSEEEKARLTIVTERLRHLMPAVKVSEVESFERALKVVQEVAESDQAIRASLGIDQRKNG